MNFKTIHIGSLISERVEELKIEISRIMKFLNCSEDEVIQMYASKSLDSELLLRWSKLLEYDFFRIYSQHIILYAPTSPNPQLKKTTQSALPSFRKSIYTKEVIDYILEVVQSGEMTKSQIIKTYRIPKTTLYKWIAKYEEKK